MKSSGGGGGGGEVLQQLSKTKMMSLWGSPKAIKLKRFVDNKDRFCLYRSTEHEIDWIQNENTVRILIMEYRNDPNTGLVRYSNG